MKKRDPNTGIIKGSFAFSNDPSERREGFLMLSEHLLVGFAESFSGMESEGFLSNHELIKEKLQELYDVFMKEYDVDIKMTGVNDLFTFEPIANEE